MLQAFAELSGGADPDSNVSLPARDVLPFQNLSPHPEIQEERAAALWKIATGAASIVARIRAMSSRISLVRRSEGSTGSAGRRRTGSPHSTMGSMPGPLMISSPRRPGGTRCPTPVGPS